MNEASQCASILEEMYRLQCQFFIRHILHKLLSVTLTEAEDMRFRKLLEAASTAKSPIQSASCTDIRHLRLIALQVTFRSNHNNFDHGRFLVVFWYCPMSPSTATLEMFDAA